MAITEEQLDLLLEDDEMNKYSKEYYKLRMTYRLRGMKCITGWA